MTASMSAGSDPRYLLKHTSRGDAEQYTRESYYAPGEVEHGEPAGRWFGPGAEQLGLRGEVVERDMNAAYGALVHPETGAALGRRPMRFRSVEERLGAALEAEPDATPERRRELEIGVRQSTRSAVHYIDVTFSAPKSWSVLHASLQTAGLDAEAAQVWDAWHEGVTEAMTYLQDTAGYSRAGFHGRNVAQRTTGRWVKADAFTMAMFDHHTSRNGDPQLHTHVPVLNRVLCADGEWRTLDSKALFAARPAAGAISERVAEEALTRSLGVQFATRPDGLAREIVGVDPRLRDLFSSRRAEITAGVAELAHAYEEKHGQAPSAYVLAKIAQHVTLDTRPAKRSPEARAELLSRWETQAREQLGADLAGIPAAAIGRQITDGEPVPFEPAVVIERAVSLLQASRSTWSRPELIQHLSRELPDCLGGLAPEQVRTLLDDLADAATSPTSDAVAGAEGGVVRLTAPEAVRTPDELRRADGRSVFEPHGGDRFATVEQLRREERLIGAASGSGAPALSREHVEALSAGLGLRPDQAAAVAGIATSGRRVDVVNAPAGTGKSYMMGALAKVWHEGVGAPVVGLTVGQSAATVLQAEGVPLARNIDRWLRTQTRLAAGQGRADDRAFAMGPGQLVIVDEASMASTQQLDQIRHLVDQHGGKMMMVGDDRQIDAVGAGGMHRLLSRQPEPGAQPYVLEDVRRFAASWERAASLQLRDGQPEVLAAYDAAGRLWEGTPERMASDAVDNTAADLLSGRSSLLMVGTNDRAAELAAQVRDRLVAAGVVEPDGTGTADGNRAGVGDLIQARENNRRLVAPDGVEVTNRHVYQITDRHADGSLTVQRDPAAGDVAGWWANPAFTLPADYVRENVTLAYASTKEASQGRTVDTGHLVVDEHTSREGLYVGMTRGRAENHAYVATEIEEGDGTPPMETDRFAVLAQIMEADQAERSATEVLRAEQDAVDHLGRLGPIWTTLVEDDARRRYGEILTGQLGPELARDIEGDDAGGPLLRLLRSGELAGRDPAVLLADAIAERSLDDAQSVAEVLHHRIGRQLDPATGGQVAETRTFAERTPDIDGPVGQYVRDLAQVMDERAARLGDRTVAQGPAWAVDRLGPVPEDPAARDDWAQRAAQVEAYREQFGYDRETDAIGPAPAAGNPDARASWERAWTALGAPEEQRPTATRTDAELRRDVDRYQREEAWAPPDVADERRAAAQRHRQLLTRAEQLRTDMVGPGRDGRERDTGEREPTLAEDHERREGIAAALGLVERRAERAGRDVAELDEIHDARTAWHAHTEEPRHAAHVAKAELDRRQPPAEPTPVEAVAAEPPQTVDPTWEPAQPAVEDREPTAAERRERLAALAAARQAQQMLSTAGQEAPTRDRQLEDDRRAAEPSRIRQPQPEPERDGRSLGG